MVCRQQLPMVDRSQAAKAIWRDTRRQVGMPWTARSLPAQRRIDQHRSGTARLFSGGDTACTRSRSATASLA